MSLSDPRSQFGIHSLTFYNRSTGEPYGILKVLGDSEINLTKSGIKLLGGSSDYPWDSQTTVSESTLTAAAKEFPDFMFEKVLGSTVNTTAASASGTFEAITNKNGTSIVASTGIASVSMKSGEEANLKAGRYVIKATGPTTVDVFIDSDIDATRGTDLTIQDDLLKVTASALTVVQSSATEIPNTGIEFTGDSGVIALVTGDTAVFEVSHPHGGVSDIVIGATSDTIPFVGVSVWGQLRDSGQYFTAEFFKVKASSGLSIPMPEKGYSVTPLTLDLLYDSAKAKVGDIKFVASA